MTPLGSLYCPACNRGLHEQCDPLRKDQPGLFCECWACLPNDREEQPCDS